MGKITPGMRIRIIEMQDRYADYTGKEGIVTLIDDANQLHGTWGGLAVIPELDEFIVLTPYDEEEQ